MIKNVFAWQGGMQHEVELRSHAMAGQSGQGGQSLGLGYAHGGMASSHDGLDAMGHVVYKVSRLVSSAATAGGSRQRNKGGVQISNLSQSPACLVLPYEHSEIFARQGHHFILGRAVSRVLPKQYFSFFTPLENDE